MNQALERARETLNLIQPSSHVVHTADSRKLGFVKSNSVKLIVTSPPYLNAYDYHKYHRHRLHWTGGDIELARDMELGKHDTFTRPNARPDRFFDDMRACFNEWERVLTDGGRIFVLIGDAIVNKEFVPVGDVFVEIAKESGLKLEERGMRNIAAGKKSFNMNARIKREHLLLFKKG
jgi:site-specific DNA-methyltransferase (cytosine-N4-specific)